jgi:hypothetical protein
MTTRSLAAAILGAFVAGVWAGKNFRRFRSTVSREDGNRAVDESIDRASEDSFPASDPPSFSGTTA